ncbi:MAG: hypothetical protein Kow0047_27320 [Anaerolineae bacterium]
MSGVIHTMFGMLGMARCVMVVGVRIYCRAVRGVRPEMGCALRFYVMMGVVGVGAMSDGCWLRPGFRANLMLFVLLHDSPPPTTLLHGVALRQRCNEDVSTRRMAYVALRGCQEMWRRVPWPGAV